MTVGQDTTEVRRHVHRMWEAVAPAWGAHAEFVDQRGKGLTDRLLELAAPRPGERVLELACGAGGAGLAAAALVGEAGEVVVSDVAEGMTRIADRRARDAGLANVRARVLDLEEIDEADGSFDVVLCREGLMFAVDPARALREIHRVLGTGGRLAASVWGPRDRNPWLGLVMAAVSAEVGSPMPPPGMPGPFALDDAGRLHGLVVDAGFAAVELSELSVPMHDASFDDWWARTSSLAGPISARLAAMPDDARARLHDRLREAVRPYEHATGLTFPGTALVVSGRHR
jgi:ubiquinone/menaquinone biosynthesis C-methylase UbiE